MLLPDAVSIGPDQIFQHGGGNSLHSRLLRNHHHLRAFVFPAGRLEGNRIGGASGEIEERRTHFVHRTLGAHDKGQISGALGKESFALEQGRLHLKIRERTLPRREGFRGNGDFTRQCTLAHLARILEIGGNLLLPVFVREGNSFDPEAAFVDHIAALPSLMSKDGDLSDLRSIEALIEHPRTAQREPIGPSGRIGQRDALVDRQFSGGVREA